jgi:general secretion pathway protein E
VAGRHNMQRPTLTIETPTGPRQLGLSDQPMTIGRSSDNVLVLGENLASRYHCVIEPVAGDFQLRDLQSRNGTKLNGEFVTRTHVLRPGDAIQIGSTILRFSVPLPTTEQPEAPAVPIVPDAAADGGLAEAVQREQTVDADNGQDGQSIPLAEATVVAGAAAAGRPGGRKSVEQAIIRAAAEDEKTLRMLTASLPNQQFDENAIEMINARGQTVHGAAIRTPADNDEQSAAATVRLLRLLLLVCFRTRATDLHVEPHDPKWELRVRVDGMMVRVMHMTPAAGMRLLSLVKILGDIDIAQKAIVQEGHFTTQVPGRRVDYRISFTPSMHGQKLVLRVLDLANSPARLRDLQLPGWMYEQARKVIHQDMGMILMCGPTGSGKTTTLYAMIREIDRRQRNVITIEDPVEYRIDGVTQIPVNEQKGNSFSNILRSVLRQDPDVLLVGEIRDVETARIAMQAASTGHLVFSTVHAQNAIGTIFRLLDLGIEPYLVASGINLVVAQRLIRQLCPDCKVARRPAPTEQMRLSRSLNTEITQIYQAVGCRRCLETGFIGRRAIFEMLTATAELRDVILATSSIQGIRKAMANTMFQSLLDSGYKMVAEGATPLEEAERVCGGNE